MLLQIRKIVLNIILMLVFFQPNHIFSSESNKDSKESILVQKKSSKIVFSNSKTSLPNIDLIDDLDTENDDEFQNTNHKKIAVLSVFNLKNILKTTTFVSKNKFLKVYLSENFSRLPRFTFLSLSSLRI